MLKYDIDLSGKSVLVTGAAGFIGSNLVKRLLNEYSQIHVIGIDSMTDYYDVNIKKERLQEIKKSLDVIVSQESELSADEVETGTYTDQRDNVWTFLYDSIANKEAIEYVFKTYRPDIVVNLAAQAGVRYSITNPDAYIESNLIGFYNILEACRHHEVSHLVYASSSSV